MFLTPDELYALTGKRQKGKQIDFLRGQAIQFYVNSSGHPVVPRSAVEGHQKEQQPQIGGWQPEVLRAG